ncbi:conserved Plasmodium protein, unknown function [Plasmodium ovale wallikeri]|uniref:Dynein regulatory complex subunit 7 MORN domain-containing protein n=1 Tax=Plasmodium ovale wallikeri TaxID=864142 RepID=A0A1A8YMI3_PLAOA|nr:conserved Plasmodium protein, unknown function [Plasmodium ovale wallikeri]
MKNKNKLKRCLDYLRNNKEEIISNYSNILPSSKEKLLLTYLRTLKKELKQKYDIEFCEHFIDEYGQKKNICSSIIQIYFPFDKGNNYKEIYTLIKNYFTYEIMLKRKINTLLLASADLVFNWKIADCADLCTIVVSSLRSDFYPVCFPTQKKNFCKFDLKEFIQSREENDNVTDIEEKKKKYDQLRNIHKRLALTPIIENKMYEIRKDRFLLKYPHGTSFCSGMTLKRNFQEAKIHRNECTCLFISLFNISYVGSKTTFYHNCKKDEYSDFLQHDGLTEMHTHYENKYCTSVDSVFSFYKYRRDRKIAKIFFPQIFKTIEYYDDCSYQLLKKLEQRIGFYAHFTFYANRSDGLTHYVEIKDYKLMEYFINRSDNVIYRSVKLSRETKTVYKLQFCIVFNWYRDMHCKKHRGIANVIFNVNKIATRYNAKMVKSYRGQMDKAVE